MKEFLKIIEKDFGVVRIDNEVSSVFEAAKILREHPKEAVILENVKESDIPVISGICNTRDKIARALNTDVAGITHRIIQGMETPKAVQNIGKISENYSTSMAN